MNVNEIYKQAKKFGMSQSCKDKMRSDMSVRNLCEMFFNEDNWSMEYDFPDIKTLRAFKGQSEQFGIFTDSNEKIENFQNAAFFGVSTPVVMCDTFSVGKLIIRHDTKAKIIAKDHAIVIVNLLDKAELEIECYDNASVTVFCYDNHNVKSTGNVKVQTSTFKK
ncbi:hypothetical protein [Chryseobacterium sp. JV274]|uniref:hypothetical protein n=1 Tax=Chryseobacterium sp. JV274 TaxID=1932669 RepID=UPI001115490F|nr:hypothetical protein [Chryseobacterium sp. JV274]